MIVNRGWQESTTTEEEMQEKIKRMPVTEASRMAVYQNLVDVIEEKIWYNVSNKSEFAWLYPSIHENDLMIQMYGTEVYHTVRLLNDYSEYGGW